MTHRNNEINIRIINQQKRKGRRDKIVIEDEMRIMTE